MNEEEKTQEFVESINGTKIEPEFKYKGQTYKKLTFEEIWFITQARSEGEMMDRFYQALTGNRHSFSTEEKKLESHTPWEDAKKIIDKMLGKK